MCVRCLFCSYSLVYIIIDSELYTCACIKRCAIYGQADDTIHTMMNDESYCVCRSKQCVWSHDVC